MDVFRITEGHSNIRFYCMSVSCSHKWYILTRFPWAVPELLLCLQSSGNSSIPSVDLGWEAMKCLPSALSRLIQEARCPRAQLPLRLLPVCPQPRALIPFSRGVSAAWTDFFPSPRSLDSSQLSFLPQLITGPPHSSPRWNGVFCGWFLPSRRGLCVPADTLHLSSPPLQPAGVPLRGACTRQLASPLSWPLCLGVLPSKTLLLQFSNSDIHGPFLYTLVHLLIPVCTGFFDSVSQSHTL